MKNKKTIFNWSGGKDSAMALYYLLNDSNYEIRYLLTSINQDSQRISMHGVRKELLYEQAQSIDIPLKELHLPKETSMKIYENELFSVMNNFTKEGIDYAAFGDIFLEDLRKYREKQLEKVQMKALFPLWKKDTKQLIQDFMALGFKTIVTAVDGSKLDASFAGRIIDKEFITDLPDNVDPCGENGEFHSFVFDGPIFKKPIDFTKGEIIKKEYTVGTCSNFEDKKEAVEKKKYTFWFCDLIPKKK